MNYKMLYIQETLRPHGYTLIHEINSGAFSKVYKIEKDNIPYALKLIKSSLEPEVDALVAGEVDILRRYKNDLVNISTLIDYFQTTTHHFIIMKYYPLDLNELVEYQMQGLNENHAKIIVRQIYDTLYFLHGRQILHRDLKLSNILIDCEEQTWELLKQQQSSLEQFLQMSKIVLGDFGLSKQSENFEAITFVGTLQTMAPEVMRRIKYSTKADIYSLGAIYYKLLENKYPKIEGDLEFKSKVSMETQNIIRKMVSYNDFDRPSYQELDRYFSFVRYRLNPSPIRQTAQANQDGVQFVKPQKIRILGYDNRVATQILAQQESLIQQESHIECLSLHEVVIKEAKSGFQMQFEPFKVRSSIVPQQSREIIDESREGDNLQEISDQANISQDQSKLTTH